MNFNYILRVSFLFNLLCFNSILNAQTIETNIPGLVIKNLNCIDSIELITADLINRNNEPFKGKVRVKISDLDNDIVWQSTTDVIVGGKNGSKIFLSFKVGKCTPPFNVKLSLE